mmetsp:Transcript_44825/g.116532  ORF Transcript_44825/g.116532 Transcript_44825/m.116532 type:complete len:290 (-) Transcript_44825:186-1055(-)
MAASRPSSLAAFLLLGSAVVPGVDAGLRTASSEDKTAYELLCGTRLGMRKWIENPCGMFSPTCQKLDFKCDGDSRVAELTIGWHQDTFGLGSLTNLLAPRTGWPILDSLAEKIGTFMTFKIRKDLTPVEEPGNPLVTRYFLRSFGCDDPMEECYIPWPEYESVREDGINVGITRFYLAYSEEVPGHPEARIEMGQWATRHSKSNFTLLGTGVEPPPTLTFAGSTGTGCAKDTPCDKPENHEVPVPFKEFEVTTYHLMEHPQGSGLYQLKSDTNKAVQEETVIHKFKENN